MSVVVPFQGRKLKEPDLDARQAERDAALREAVDDYLQREGIEPNFCPDPVACRQGRGCTCGAVQPLWPLIPEHWQVRLIAAALLAVVLAVASVAVWWPA